MPETAVVHRENIGAGLSPQQAARTIWARLQAVMQREVEHRRRRVSLERDLAQAEESLRQAEREESMIQRRPIRNPEQYLDEVARRLFIAELQAASDRVRSAREARRTALDELSEVPARLNHRGDTNGTHIESGRVYEGAYNPVTGEMAIVGSGSEQATYLASPEVVRARADGRPVTTIAGHCGMPRAVDAVVSAGLESHVVVNRGGLRLNGSRLALEYVTACEQCEGILQTGANRGRVRTAGPVPRHVPPNAPANETYDMDP